MEEKNNKKEETDNIKIKQFKQYDKITHVEHGLDEKAEKTINNLSRAVTLLYIILVLGTTAILIVLLFAYMNLPNIDEYIKQLIQLVKG